MAVSHWLETVRGKSSLKSLSLSSDESLFKRVKPKAVWRFVRTNTLIPVSLIAISLIFASWPQADNPAIGGFDGEFNPVDHKTVAQLAFNQESGVNNEDYSISSQVTTVNEDYVFQTGGIETIISRNNRDQTITYEVLPGESVGSLASDFGLSRETLRLANDLSSNSLSEGRELRIPPVDGLFIEVDRGDTLSSIADQYNISVQNIYEYNSDLSQGSSIFSGQEVFVPGAVMERQQYNSQTQQQRQNVVPQNPAAGSSQFIWPTTNPTRYLSQRYGRTNFSRWHTGIDLNRLNGRGIYAAADGVAHIRTGATGYGNLITVSHSNGWETYYAHLREFRVQDGQYVRQGDLIGIMGTTGRSTGPHLHFELRRNGNPLNPMNYLP